MTNSPWRVNNMPQSVLICHAAVKFDQTSIQLLCKALPGTPVQSALSNAERHPHAQMLCNVQQSSKYMLTHTLPHCHTHTLTRTQNVCFLDMYTRMSTPPQWKEDSCWCGSAGKFISVSPPACMPAAPPPLEPALAPVKLPVST